MQRIKNESKRFPFFSADILKTHQKRIRFTKDQRKRKKERKNRRLQLCRYICTTVASLKIKDLSLRLFLKMQGKSACDKLIWLFPPFWF